MWKLVFDDPCFHFRNNYRISAHVAFFKHFLVLSDLRQLLEFITMSIFKSQCKIKYKQNMAILKKENVYRFYIQNIYFTTLNYVKCWPWHNIYMQKNPTQKRCIDVMIVLKSFLDSFWIVLDRFSIFFG